MLSVVIITKNSQKYIKEVITSASFANEVLILDSGSEDNTCNIAKELGTRVEYQEWLGFGRQKQKAVDLAKNEWVFVLDSDEIITTNLQKEIINTLKNPKYDAYYTPRLNNFFGKWIRYSGLYPDYSIRLFSKKKCRFNQKEVHESVECKGKVGYLKNHLKHYAYESIEEFINKQNYYSTLGAKPNKIKAIFAPFWSFFKLFVIKRGFLDGWEGFIIAKLYSQYTFWKYIKAKNENISN